MELKPRFSAVRLEHSGHLRVLDAGESNFIETELLPRATVHPWITIVRFRTPEKKQHTLISTVDNLKPEDFRRLRVFLRWRAKFGRANDDA
jgi:toxin CptA